MKPILFSGPMVRAIIDGRKIMTRRVIKPQPDIDDPCIIEHPMALEDDLIGFTYQTEQGETKRAGKFHNGDVLWVRETWRYGCKQDEIPYDYLADYSSSSRKWKSAMFMPRIAARLFLKVTGIRLERLQDITEYDAKREGAEPECSETRTEDDICNQECYKCGLLSHRAGFHLLWDSLNVKRGCSWESNPWVYVVSFKRINKTEAENNCAG